jgi:hypothetical protein
MDTKTKKRVDKKMLTFFLIAFPTLLIVALAQLEPGTWWAQILLAFFQFTLLKQFLDNYYEELE